MSDLESIRQTVPGKETNLPILRQEQAPVHGFLITRQFRVFCGPFVGCARTTPVCKVTDCVRI